VTKWVAWLALFGPAIEPDAEPEPPADVASPPAEDEPAAGEDAEVGAPEGSEVDPPEGDATAPEPEPAAKPSPPPPVRAKPSRPPPDYDPDSGVPPGGYWAPGEAPEIAPDDGHETLLVAYIVLPLATLTTVSGALNLWLTHPDHCPRRLAYVGLDATPGECRSLLIVNAIRTSYGALGVVTGAVFLAIGLHRKKQYELWKKRRFRASFVPGGGLRIQF
jgi:hypothetical protein